MAFDPDAFLAAAPAEAFDPDAFLGAVPGVESRIVELGGVRQPDGTYVVPGSGGSPSFRLDAQGNRLDAAPAIGEESAAESALGKVVATAGSALLPVAPQMAGLSRAAHTIGTDESFADAYRKQRDTTKADIESAKQKAGLGYEILGGVISGGIAAPGTVAGRMALSGGLSAAGAALSSDVDLTKDGDLGEYAKDIVTAAGIGTIAGGVGETLGWGFRKAAGAARNLAGKAWARQAVKEAADVEARYGKGVLPSVIETLSQQAPDVLPGRVGYELTEGSRFVAQAAETVADGLPGRAGTELVETSRFPAGVVAREGMRMGNTARRHALSSAAESGVESSAGRLPGASGFEMTETSRFPDVIKEVLSTAADGLPGRVGYAVSEASRFVPPAVGDLVHLPAPASPSDLASMAAEKVAEYFRSPIWSTDILPALKKSAPRYGKALAGAAAGAAFDEATGSDIGKWIGGSFSGNILRGGGMTKMALGVAKSPRVQRAVMNSLAKIMSGAATAITRGTTMTAAEIAAYATHEDALGPPNLVAEQLVSRGGIGSLLGDNGTTDPEVAALNAPQSALDRGIAQTVGVTVLAGALEDHGDKLDKAMARVFRGEHEAPAKEHPVPDDLAHLAANPEAMLERLANNTGSLSEVAPMVAAELSATAQRATAYLAQVSTRPDRRGPLAPEWMPSAAEKRSLRLATDVVASPMSILDAAAAGTLAPEQVAALNAVYPMLGRSIADKALSMLDTGKAVPYRARLMVGFLTGIDVDGTLTSVSRNQQAIQAQSQKPSNQGAPPSGGADQLTVAQRSMPRQEKETS